MSRFAYSAILNTGQRVRGTLRSRDRREATRRLLELGYHPVEVEPAEHGRSAVARITREGLFRVRPIELAVFTRQFASLLKAGMPMVQALGTLARQCESPRLSRVVQELEETLSLDAATLSDAMEAHPKVFGPVYRGLVRSGEEGGHLPEVLSDLAGHLSRSARLRGQVIGAFLYPAFLLVLGFASVFVLTAFVIPSFSEMFTAFGQSLPLPTRVLIAVSDFMATWWWAVVVALAGGALVAVGLLRRPASRSRLDRALLRLPVIGSMVLKLEVARVSQTLAALLSSGVRILEALRVTRETVHNLALRGTFEEITRRVSTGEPLAQALEAAKLYPAMMVNLVRTGEETGELPEMLSELAQIYEDEAERAVAGAVKLLEPALIVGMGGLIAGMVAAVILPIFQANAFVG